MIMMMMMMMMMMTMIIMTIMTAFSKKSIIKSELLFLINKSLHFCAFCLNQMHTWALVPKEMKGTILHTLGSQ